MVVENAPVHKRGFLGSLVQVGNPIGNLAAIGMFALVSQLPESEFMADGLGRRYLAGLAVLDDLRADHGDRDQHRAGDGEQGIDLTATTSP
jgi:hypothetical protein